MMTDSNAPNTRPDRVRCRPLQGVIPATSTSGSHSDAVYGYHRCHRYAGDEHERHSPGRSPTAKVEASRPTRRTRRDHDRRSAPTPTIPSESDTAFRGVEHLDRQHDDER
jgi:hypothetical protein